MLDKKHKVLYFNIERCVISSITKKYIDFFRVDLFT